MVSDYPDRGETSQYSCFCRCVCRASGSEKSARSFSDRSFFVDVRAACPCQNAFFQDLEGLTEVFGRLSAGSSGRKLPLWADFSFLNNLPRSLTTGSTLRPLEIAFATPEDQADIKHLHLRLLPKFWTCPEYGLAFPEPNLEQIRKHPENALRANSEFPGFVRLEIPKPWKIKQTPSPD